MNGYRGPTRPMGSVLLLAAVTLWMAACGGEGVRTDAVVASSLLLAEANASNPTVAVGSADGPAFVAWVETVDGSSNVLLRRIEPDGAVGPAVRVNDRPGDAAPHLQAPAQVVADGERVFVLWQNNTPIEGRMFPASNLRLAWSEDGGRSFSPAEFVNEDAAGPPASHTFHDMTLMPDGRVAISWLDGRESGLPAGDASMAHHPGGDAGMVEGGDTSEETDGEADGQTDEGTGDAGPSVRVTLFDPTSATFSPESVVDGNACPCCRTDIAAGADGSLLVGWRKVYPGDVRDMVVARSMDGGSAWEPPARVHEDGWVIAGCPHAGPALATTSVGGVEVAWFTGAESAPGLWFARSAPGPLTFGPPIPLIGLAVAASQVDIAPGEGGSWLVWEDRREVGGGSVLSWVPAGASPTAGARIVLPGRNPAIASGGSRTVVAWLAGDRIEALVDPVMGGR